MPKVEKKKNINGVQYDSMADFYRHIDEYKTLDGKLDYATKYILSHDMGVDKDYAFEGVVNLARQKIAEIINRSKRPADKNNPRAKMFLGNPAGYLKGEAQKLSKNIDEADVSFEGDKELKENCERIAKAMDDDFNAQVFEVDKISKSIGLRSKVEAGFGGKKELEANLKVANSRKWYAIFSSSSSEWKKLEEAYEDFNNPNREEFGDYSYLSNSAIRYLQHKVPNWEPSRPFPENAFNKFNASETAKVNFSLNIMKAVRSQLATDESFHNLVDEAKEEDIKYEDLPEKNQNVIDLDQVQFQSKLKEDANIENDSIEENQVGVSLDIKHQKNKDPYIRIPEED